MSAALKITRVCFDYITKVVLSLNSLTAEAEASESGVFSRFPDPATMYQKLHSIYQSIEYVRKYESAIQLYCTIDQNAPDTSCFKILDDLNNLLSGSLTLLSFKVLRLSDGEQANLSMYPSIDEQLSMTPDSRKHFILLFDEIERCMHPEMCRTLIDDLMKFLSQYDTKTFQIIISSHSTFVVGDMKKENLICLTHDDDPKSALYRVTNRAELGESFGQNIHTLLKQNFFLNCTFSQYAYSMLKLTAECLMCKKGRNSEGTSDPAVPQWLTIDEVRTKIYEQMNFNQSVYPKHLPESGQDVFDFLESVIHSIREPLLRESLQEELEHWSIHSDFLDFKIEQKEQELEQLKQMRNSRFLSAREEKTMIRIFLPDHFSESSIVREVYASVIQNILKAWAEFPDSNPILTDPPRNLSTPQEREDFLREFLLSKTFYEYRFVHHTPSGFWYDLSRLSARCNLQPILDGKHCTSQHVINFRSTYDRVKNPDLWEPYYKELRNISAANNCRTLSDFRKAVHDDVVKDPKDPLEYIFSYHHLDSPQRNCMIDAMNVPVCPYCNMNYTISLARNGTVNTTADLDHFYVKSSYPEYALCPYNFIPSCQVCNNRLKLNTDMGEATHIYPHRDSFGNHAVFHIDNMSNYLLDGGSSANSPGIGLEIDPNTDQKLADKIRSSAAVFQLEARYQSIENYAEEMIDKAQIYTENYNQELAEQFQSVFDGESIRDMVFGPKESERQYARRSLGKLRMDLLKQLKIY